MECINHRLVLWAGLEVELLLISVPLEQGGLCLPLILWQESRGGGRQTARTYLKTKEAMHFRLF